MTFPSYESFSGIVYKTTIRYGKLVKMVRDFLGFYVYLLSLPMPPSTTSISRNDLIDLLGPIACVDPVSNDVYKYIDS